MGGFFCFFFLFFFKVKPTLCISSGSSYSWQWMVTSTIHHHVSDNAYDPDVAAKQLCIEKQTIQNETCLVFTDNGHGMNPETLHRMLRWKWNLDGFWRDTSIETLMCCRVEDPCVCTVCIRGQLSLLSGLFFNYIKVTYKNMFRKTEITELLFLQLWLLWKSDGQEP